MKDFEAMALPCCNEVLELLQGLADRQTALVKALDMYLEARGRKFDGSDDLERELRKKISLAVDDLNSYKDHWFAKSCGGVTRSELFLNYLLSKEEK